MDNPIAEAIAEKIEEEIMQIDGFDDCIVGYVSRQGQPTILLYSEDLIINSLMKNDGMDYDEAVEHFEFNIAGSYMGDGTPGFFAPAEEL